MAEKVKNVKESTLLVIYAVLMVLAVAVTVLTT